MDDKMATDRQIDEWERQTRNFESVSLPSDDFKALLNRLDHAASENARLTALLAGTGLGHCTGCTSPDGFDRGGNGVTHQMGTIEHPDAAASGKGGGE